jgi:mRNA interferase RelE/StbE
MTEYAIGVSPQAEKQIKSLRKRQQRQIVEALRRLKADPRPKGVEKLSQNPKFWRLRVGEYRIVYAIDDRARQVVVAIVRHRKDAYRDLDKLKPELLARTLRPFLQPAATIPRRETPPRS